MLSFTMDHHIEWEVHKLSYVFLGWTITPQWKMKIEFTMLDGHFIALCSKSYLAECKLEQKIATKGIPHNLKLEREVSRCIFNVNFI